jgi:restriction system protein
MKKGNESILDLLVEAPWWVSLVVAGVAFLVLRYLLPGISADNLVLKAIARIDPVIALWVALVLLIPAPISLYHFWRKKVS